MSPISDDRNNERAGTMIVVHHLNNSRSQRVLWLLEELNTPYRVETYWRDAKTNLAPSELRAVHPLGKSPVIQDGDLVLAVSGAIIEYLLERHGNGRLVPARGTNEHVRYLHWMHFAEGTIMLHLVARLYVGRVGDAATTMQARVEGMIKQTAVEDGAAVMTRFAAGPTLIGIARWGGVVWPAFHAPIAIRARKRARPPHP